MPFLCSERVQTAAYGGEAATQVAYGPEEPTVAREERRDRLSPRCLRLRKRILPRGMACHVRLTDVWRQMRLPERRIGRAVGPTGRNATDCRAVAESPFHAEALDMMQPTVTHGGTFLV